MPIIPIIAAAAVGAAAFGIVSSSQQRKEAKAQSQAQATQITRLESEFAAQEEATEKSQAGQIAKRKQKERAAAAVGRRSTLLTSPIGVVGEPAGGKKTLLGL